MLRLDDETFARLVAYAKRSGRPRAEIQREAFVEYLDRAGA